MGTVFAAFMFATLVFVPFFSTAVENGLFVASGVALLSSVACFVISKKRETQTSCVGLYIIGTTLLVYAFVYFVLV